MLGVEHAAPALGFAEGGGLCGGGPEVVKAPGDTDEGVVTDEGVRANGGVEGGGVVTGLIGGTAAGCVGTGATGFHPGAPLAAVGGITGVGVAGLEGLDVEDAALELGEDGCIEGCVDLGLEGLSRGDATHTQQIQALSTASKVNFYPCENDDKARACIKRALETGKTQVYEHTLEALDIHLETRFVTRDQNTVLAIVRDITERKKSEDRIFNLAYFDELTALPNRQLFGRSLERTIEKAERDDEQFAVLFEIGRAHV